MDYTTKALLGLTMALLIARSADTSHLWGLLGDAALSMGWFAYGVFFLAKDAGWLK
jgi:hypothetical protein